MTLTARTTLERMPIPTHTTNSGASAPSQPLFIQLHRFIRQAPDRPVEAREWNLLLLLTSNGAELSLPDAAPVVADLRKTATPVFNGVYYELK